MKPSKYFFNAVPVTIMLILFTLALFTCSKKAGKEILIGAHIPLSGTQASVGAEQKWAYEQAVEDINNAGGIYVKEFDAKLRVRLIVLDDETDPRKAVAAVEKLIKEDNVDLLLSGQGGAMGVIHGMITAEKNKKYYHGCVLWVPNFLEHNFQWCTMYFFDMGQGGVMPFEVFNSLPEKDRPKRPAIFHEDTFDAKMMGDVYEQLGQKYGYKFVARLKTDVGGKDFTSQIKKAKEAGVDAVFCVANPDESAILVKQMKDNKLNFKYFQGLKGTWPTMFYKTLGKDADYIFCDGFWSADYPFAGAKELGEKFHKKFGEDSISIGMYYALCQTLFQAIEKAGTLDSAKVRQAVLDNQFDTVNGKVDYDDKGIALFPLADFQWLDGKRQVIYPFNLAKFKVKIAPPWDKR